MVLDLPILTRQIKLEKDITLSNRYLLPEDSEKFLEQILDLACSFVQDMNSDTPLFRARLHEPLNRDTHVPYFGYEYKPKAFSTEDMGAPPTNKCLPGRLNPSGIPFLYCALDADTAVSEMKPWKGAYLTVAELKLARDARVVDLRCREISEINEKTDQTVSEKWWLVFQHTVCTSFAIPYHPSDSYGYVPTQMYASAIKSRGFDGVLYSSAMNGTGHNVALFDTKIAEPTQTWIACVDDVKYEIRNSNPMQRSEGLVAS